MHVADFANRSNYKRNEWINSIFLEQPYVGLFCYKMAARQWKAILVWFKVRCAAGKVMRWNAQNWYLQTYYMLQVL